MATDFNTQHRQKPSICFIGIEFGAKCCWSLKRLIDEGYRVDGIICDRGALKRKLMLLLFGGGMSLRQLAISYGIPIFPLDLQIRKNRNLIDLFTKLAFRSDVLVCSAWPYKISSTVLKWPKIGAYNCHSSYLPAYAGGNPIKAPLINFDKFTGVTFHEMTDLYDSGRIIYQEKLPIVPFFGYLKLLRDISALTPNVIIKGLRNIEMGIDPIPNTVTRIVGRMTLTTYIKLRSMNHIRRLLKKELIKI
jgi:methionyl-tRNA formyltransferase